MATKNNCSSLNKSTVTDSKSGSRFTNINLTQNRKCQDFYPINSKSISNQDEKIFYGKTMTLVQFKALKTLYFFLRRTRIQYLKCEPEFAIELQSTSIKLVGKNYESLKEKSYGNSSWNKCEKNFKTFNFTNLYNSDKNQHQFQHKDNLSSNSSSSSTLSLHISAYESSIEAENNSDEQRKVTLKTFKSDPFNKIKNGIKQNFLSFSLSNSFEFPRQQENQVGGEPEIMQFKSSQKLLAPTDSSSKANSSNKETSHEPPTKKLKSDETMENEATCSIIPKLNRPAYTNKHILRKSFDQFHLLIGVAGSVATIKIAELIEEFHKKNPENLVIKVVATKASLHFFDPTELPVDVYVDEDEWNMWKNRGDPVLHIELRKWADAILIAPMDVNTLAKVANGLSDNLLTSILRAWDFSKYAFFAPAMNTCMWEHPLTGQHLKTVKELLLFKEIPPMEKELMCGDKGYGAMAALPMIVSIVSAEIRNKFAVYTR